MALLQFLVVQFKSRFPTFCGYCVKPLPNEDACSIYYYTRYKLEGSRMNLHFCTKKCCEAYEEERKAL